MDHRWDEYLRDEHGRRAEQGRYGSRRIEEDEEVDRRDRIAQGMRRPNRSPWDIGAAHWDQRDLYTRNARIDDRGYARGPSIHPEVGSYAYPRDEIYRQQLRRDRRQPPLRSGREPSVYELEAWPWLQYERVQPIWWSNLRDYLKHKVSRLIGKRSRAQGPKGWRRSDDSIREDVCEALAYHGHLDASDIEVAVKDGEVTLSGTVRDRPQKRLAEWLTDHVHGVIDVHNRLKVRRAKDVGGGGFDLDFALPSRA